MSAAGPADGSQADALDALPGFVSRSRAGRALAELAARAAGRATSVLVTGESGAGKSHLARAMHAAGRGAAAPFVIIDCANLPEALAENELFGHEAGAFSGAETRQAGKFEVAHGGTVLLDRVSDLPPEVQGKLLRVLQERAFERVGGRVTVSVDVTVIATASEDLAELVRRGAFRDDLFWRLDVVHLQVPPLRDRPEDVRALAELFAERVGTRVGRPCHLSDAAMHVLEAQSWPGNVRELQNVIERTVTLKDVEVIQPADLALEAGGHRSPDRAVADLADQRLSLEELERLYIVRVLRNLGGKIGRAAEVLGIHRKTLLEKRKRYGIDA